MSNWECIFSADAFRKWLCKYCCILWCGCGFCCVGAHQQSRYVQVIFVCPVFRYHITASGCDLARKLVQADAMVDDAVCIGKPQHIKNSTKPTDQRKRHVSEPTACQPPVAAVTAAAVTMDTADCAVVSDEDKDWQKELGYVFSEQVHSWWIIIYCLYS